MVVRMTIVQEYHNRGTCMMLELKIVWFKTYERSVRCVGPVRRKIYRHIYGIEYDERRTD